MMTTPIAIILTVLTYSLVEIEPRDYLLLYGALILAGLWDITSNRKTKKAHSEVG